MAVSEANTVYDTTKPWQSNEERLTGASLAVATLSGDIIRAIRPTVPQIVYRPLYGYPDYSARQIGIRDVGLLDRRFPTIDYTGRTSGYSGSVRNGFPALNTF